MTDTKKIRRALISVSNKEGLAEFAHVLQTFGVEILSTGGTATFLQEHDIPVIEISDYTNFPEIMAGRVKTLHPKVHGGILGRRDTDNTVMQAHDIQPIDLVVVNLYPFETTIKQTNCTLEQAIENIDIGGPTLIRAAAKNHHDVTVVVDPEDYSRICEAISSNEQGISFALRSELAKKAFAKTAAYDAEIANYLYRTNSDDQFPQIYLPCFYKKMSLRYGENPQQAAAFYTKPQITPGTLAAAKQLQGKELSFNNLVDANTALSCVKQFGEFPACVIVKHANPCGAATGETILAAYQKAFATDPKSAFGGIIAVNQLLDVATLETILAEQFVEVLIAPQIETGGIAIAKQKPNLRLMLYGNYYESNTETYQELEYKTIDGGLLVQTVDKTMLNQAKLAVVTKRMPTKDELADLSFAFQMVKFVKSNAIVYAKNQQTIGIGAGQMSRIDSAELGLKKAQDAGLVVKDAVMASDAFFPFRDVVDIAAKNGISAIIQPGGSVRDAEVIQAADEANIAMVFTGVRVFSH